MLFSYLNHIGLICGPLGAFSVSSRTKLFQSDGKDQISLRPEFDMSGFLC